MQTLKNRLKKIQGGSLEPHIVKVLLHVAFHHMQQCLLNYYYVEFLVQDYTSSPLTQKLMWTISNCSRRQDMIERQKHDIFHLVTLY